MKRADSIETTQAPKGGYKTTPRKPKPKKKRRGGILGAVEGVGRGVAKGADRAVAYVHDYDPFIKQPQFPKRSPHTAAVKKAIGPQPKPRKRRR